MSRADRQRRKGGPANRGTNGGRARAGRAVTPTPPASETRRRLPLAEGHLSEGPGPKAGDGRHALGECSRYDACLTAHATAYREGYAHCEAGCRWHEAATPPAATCYVSLNGAARGAT